MEQLNLPLPEETTTHLIIALDLTEEYTGILAELAYWFQNANSEQTTLLTAKLREVTDSLHELMPKII